MCRLKSLNACLLALASAVACFTAVTTASSGPVTDDLPELVRKWGLVGRWSTDCSPEATPGFLVEYEIGADGLASISNGQSVTEMRIALINPDGDLTLQTINDGGTKVLVLRRLGDTLRPDISQPEQTDYTMRNGKFVASLKETAPLRHCDG